MKIYKITEASKYLGMNDKQGEKLIMVVLTFCIGLFFYLGWCGFKNIQP